MQMVFVNSIRLQKVRNLPAIEIPFDSEQKKHLIVTGPNGSGKTTVLNELKKYCQGIRKELLIHCTHAITEANVSRYEDVFATEKGEIYRKIINNQELKLREASSAVMTFNDSISLYSQYIRNDYIICSFDAHRKVSFIEPKGPSKIEQKNTVEEGIGKYFVQLLVNLRSRRSFARDDNDIETVKKIEKWFDNFEKALAVLLGHTDFVLKFDSVDFNFTIEEKGKEPYHFSELSDGYSALLSIVSELMLRMSLEPLATYDKYGLVFIDEIENHLHVELQKKVLPFLTTFFPNIQFIVTTHSPFVLSSIADSVIFDLEKHRRYTDFSDYSYSSIIEDYYGIDTYSEIIVKNVKEVEDILQKENLTDEELARIKLLYDSVNELPETQFVSPELRVKLNSLVLNNYSKLNGIL